MRCHALRPRPVAMPPRASTCSDSLVGVRVVRTCVVGERSNSAMQTWTCREREGEHAARVHIRTHQVDPTGTASPSEEPSPPCGCALWCSAPRTAGTAGTAVGRRGVGMCVTAVPALLMAEKLAPRREGLPCGSLGGSAARTPAWPSHPPSSAPRFKIAPLPSIWLALRMPIISIAAAPPSGLPRFVGSTSPFGASVDCSSESAAGCSDHAYASGLMICGVSEMPRRRRPSSELFCGGNGIFSWKSTRGAGATNSQSSESSESLNSSSASSRAHDCSARFATATATSELEGAGRERRKERKQCFKHAHQMKGALVRREGRADGRAAAIRGQAHWPGRRRTAATALRHDRATAALQVRTEGRRLARTAATARREYGALGRSASAPTGARSSRCSLPASDSPRPCVTPQGRQWRACSPRRRER